MSTNTQSKNTQELLYQGICQSCKDQLEPGTLVKFTHNTDTNRWYISACPNCDSDCRGTVDMKCMKPRTESLAQSIKRRNAKREKNLAKKEIRQ